MTAPTFTCPYCNADVTAKEAEIDQSFGKLKAWKFECGKQDGFLGSHWTRLEKQEAPSVDLPPANG